MNWNEWIDRIFWKELMERQRGMNIRKTRGLNDVKKFNFASRSSDIGSGLDAEMM